MTTLSLLVPCRGKSYEPGAFIPALPLASTEASVDRWRTAVMRWLVSLPPSAYAYDTLHQSRKLSLPERLLDALAAFKVKTATVAAAHFNRDERARLFKQLDSLLDAESWDSNDAVATEASFTTLLRMALFLEGRRPALGITGTGNFIATWTDGDDRLNIECKPEDNVRWVLLQKLDGQRESGAGETTVRRLPDVLRPYDAPKRWFPNAVGQTLA